MIGNRLKQLREQKGLKQEVLAKKLGITQQMVSLYEKNINEPDIETIKKLSEIFNCSIDYLLGRDVYRTDNRIKQLRLQKGINQDVLAKLLGLEIAGISKLETGRVPLKDEYILKLADYFNVSTDYLLGRDANNDSDSENKEIFANNLNYYMKLNNKTRLDVCNDLCFSYTTFTSWCKGQFYPRIDKIESLANYFGIEKSDLIENKSDVERQNIKDFAINQSNYDNSKYENNPKTKVEQILELADGLNIQEANYLIKKLNKAVIKIEKEAK